MAGPQVCAFTDTFTVPGLWGYFGGRFRLLGLLLVTGLVPLLLLPLLAQLGLDHGLGLLPGLAGLPLVLLLRVVVFVILLLDLILRSEVYLFRSIARVEGPRVDLGSVVSVERSGLPGKVSRVMLTTILTL